MPCIILGGQRLTGGDGGFDDALEAREPSWRARRSSSGAHLPRLAPTTSSKRPDLCFRPSGGEGLDTSSQRLALGDSHFDAGRWTAARRLPDPTVEGKSWPRWTQNSNCCWSERRFSTKTRQPLDWKWDPTN